MLEELKKEYATQDNRCTAYPIYVTVQELKCVGIIDESYGTWHDSEVIYEYSHEAMDDDPPAKTKEDVVEYLKNECEYSGKQLAREIENISEFPMLYVWMDIEFFLTIKGVEEYIAANKHNLGKTRTYVKHFSRRNFEMRGLLEAIGFRVRD